MNIFAILILSTTLCSGQFLEKSVLVDSNWENVIFGGFHPPTHALSPESTEPLIIGGTEAARNAYPYQISLQVVTNGARYHICGGSILSSTKVACAAHCCVDQTVSRLLVVAGAHNMKVDESTQQRVGVSRAIPHPLFSSATLENDACKIFLATPLQLNSQVATIPLCSTQPAAGTICEATGWGLTNPSDPNAPLPNALQVVNLATVSLLTCNSNYLGVNPVTLSMLCAGSVAGKGGCNGDSGGPLKCIVNGQQCLAGCTSWGVRPCAQANKPTVYANVAYPPVYSFYNSN